MMFCFVTLKSYPFNGQWCRLGPLLKQICIKSYKFEYAHLVSMSIKGLRNISTIRLFMNIYEPYILSLDKEPCKVEVLKWNKWL